MFLSVIILIVMESDLRDAGGDFSSIQECDTGTTIVGEKLHLSYTFENAGRLLLVSLVQDFPEGFHNPAVRRTFLLHRTRSVSISITMDEGGMFSIPRPRVFISDLFRISARSIDFGEVREITVLSGVARMRTELFRPKNYRMLPGNIASRYAGSGYEFHSIRQYDEGQPLHHVNWKTSARLDELWVNDFVSERSGTMLIILDVKMIDSDEDLTKRYAGRAAFAASSMAYSAIMERNSVGMIVLGERPFRVKPDYGIRQFQRISHLLASIGISRHPSPAQIDKAAEVYGKAFAQHVVISPLADDETLDSVATLAMNFRDVWTIVPIIFERTSTRTGEDVARELLRLSQQNNAIRLSKVCRTITWDRSEALQSVIEIAGKAMTRGPR